MTDYTPVVLSAVGSAMLTGIVALVGQAVTVGKIRSTLEAQAKDQVDRHTDNTKKFDGIEAKLSAGEDGLFVTRREHDLTTQRTADSIKRMEARLEGIENDVTVLVRRGSTGGRRRRT